ncbi:MAG TPA: 2-amino-4-hydroxy-6-hydroxymethyldihydropteridine diphosphokinase, partial [bacterium]|nr:2-amino-4-hydroxy-6-hydroxymethyldihydropteridine diphosphokinase [bacterium]
ESHKERYNNANAIFQNSGLTNIAQIKGHCPGYFENLNEKFDFIFIDVVKHLYLETFKKSVNLLKANGIIAADNIKTHKAETAEFIEYLLALADYKTEIIDVGNGLSITSKKEHIVFLGLGANIAPELENIRQALKQLENNPNIKILQKSSIYISEPIGYTEQPEFYNCALKIKTEFKPLELLEFIKKIEKELCRVSSEIHWGPRTIDVDILLYDDLILETENLTIPHKELTNRRFAIEPLLEIEPQIFYPNKDINLTNLYFSEKIQRQKVKKLNILW